MMRIAVVDDDPHEASCLRDFLSAHTVEGTSIDMFASGEAFLESWQAHAFDLILLDIFMGELSGIDVARKIRHIDQDVCLVFCTTSNEFASESYDVNAGYYLRKPITEDKIAGMLHKLDLDRLLTINLPDGHRLLLRDILYIVCAGHNLTIYCRNSHELTLRMTQRHMLDLLGGNPDFISCSKGILVNIRAVTHLSEDGFLLSDGSLVPISRRKMKEMKEVYTDFLFQQLRRKV